MKTREISPAAALNLELDTLAQNWALEELPLKQAWKDFQFAYWSKLISCYGSISAAAKAKGVHRNTVARGLNAWRKG